MKPLKKFSAGQISVAIWPNEATIDGRKTTVLKATVERRYTDKDGTWKSSNSFSKHEIPQAVFCLLQAYATILQEGQSKEEESE